MSTTLDRIAALAPTPEPLDDTWSTATLARIVAEPQERRATPWWRRSRRRAVGVVVAALVTVSAGAAVAGVGPVQVVRDAILDFSRQPNTTGNGLGTLPDPVLVAKFRTERGLFAMWVATSSTGKVCTAETDATWDGEGTPTRKQLSGYGCGGIVLNGRGHPVELTRPDQLGGFFKDTEPLVWGVSRYPGTVRVRVTGTGVDRTLPVRADSLGYGATLPEASRAKAVTFTYLDATGRVLGTKRYVAPVG